MIRRYCFILYAFVSTSPLSGHFLFSRFPVQSLVFSPKSLFNTPKFRDTLVSTCRTVHGAQWGRRGGYLGWCRGILGLGRVFNRACSLTFQPDSWFWIPVRLLLPQGTGEPSSVDHSWVGPRNGDCDSEFYPPLYLQKGLFYFLCHESTQFW